MDLWVFAANEKISLSTSGFGKVRAFGFDFRIGDAGLDQIFGVVAVQDGEIALVAERFGVQPEDSRADGVKGAAPQARAFPVRANPTRDASFRRRPCW